MTMDDGVLQVLANALWDPNPTTSDEQACQLAEALGYPPGWRVTRSTTPEGLYFDRITSGDPSTPECDQWFHHAGALEAAANWCNTAQTQFVYKGGHLLAPQAAYRKGDKVQVLYEEEWWDAKIMRVKA